MEHEKVQVELSDDQTQFVVNALRKYTDDNKHSWPDHFVAFAEKTISTVQAAIQS